MNQQIIWKPVNHPNILPGYLVSPQGYIKADGMKDDDAIKEPSYHSTNGYDFVLLNNKDGNLQLFPLDDIIAMAYIPIPESLKDKFIEKEYDNDFEEAAEEWRIMYQTSTSCMYRVVTDLNDITIIISELSNIDYGVIGRCGITDDHNNLFDIIKDGKSMG